VSFSLRVFRKITANGENIKILAGKELPKILLPRGFVNTVCGTRAMQLKNI